MGGNERPGQTASEAVLSAVAEAKGVDERELAVPLYEAIDPDALDALFRNGQGEVTFQYHDYHVTVDHTNAVELRPASSEMER